VMARNPGRIENDYRIDLPRPRSLAVRGAAEYSRYLTELRNEFARLGVLKAE